MELNNYSVDELTQAIQETLPKRLILKLKENLLENRKKAVNERYLNTLDEITICKEQINICSQSRKLLLLDHLKKLEAERDKAYQEIERMEL